MYSFCAGGLNEIMKCTKMEILAILCATACHDVGHPGVNNKYLCSTHDKTAIQVIALGFVVVHCSIQSCQPLTNMCTQLSGTIYLLLLLNSLICIQVQ